MCSKRWAGTSRESGSSKRSRPVRSAGRRSTSACEIRSASVDRCSGARIARVRTISHSRLFASRRHSAPCRRARHTHATGPDAPTSRRAGTVWRTKRSRVGSTTSAAARRPSACTDGGGAQPRPRSFERTLCARALTARASSGSHQRTPLTTIRLTAATRSSSGIDRRGARWLTITTPGRQRSRTEGLAGRALRRGRGSKSLAPAVFATVWSAERVHARNGRRFRAMDAETT